jgi:outer membrane immunogenic protein
MKKVLVATLAFSALVAGPAMAADLARPAPVPYKAPPPVYFFSWTGCYVGGNVGGFWVRKEWFDRIAGDPLFNTSFGTHDVTSWLGGGQVGCNYQFYGGWVVGIQGDYDWTNANGSNVNLLLPFLTDNSKVRALASVTGRVGYAWDRFLGYVKGGGAWERDDYNFITTAGFVTASASETRSGWTVGVGGEYAFTNWLTGFVEYDYYDFGTRNNTFVCAGAVACFLPAATTGTVGIREQKSVVKAGLNFLFGPGGPVVAQY